MGYIYIIFLFKFIISDEILVGDEETYKTIDSSVLDLCAQYEDCIIHLKTNIIVSEPIVFEDPTYTVTIKSDSLMNCPVISPSENFSPNSPILKVLTKDPTGTAAKFKLTISNIDFDFKQLSGGLDITFTEISIEHCTICHSLGYSALNVHSYSALVYNNGNIYDNIMSKENIENCKSEETKKCDYELLFSNDICVDSLSSASLTDVNTKSLFFSNEVNPSLSSRQISNSGYSITNLFLKNADKNSNFGYSFRGQYSNVMIGDKNGFTKLDSPSDEFDYMPSKLLHQLEFLLPQDKKLFNEATGKSIELKDEDFHKMANTSSSYKFIFIFKNHIYGYDNPEATSDNDKLEDGYYILTYLKLPDGDGLTGLKCQITLSEDSPGIVLLSNNEMPIRSEHDKLNFDVEESIDRTKNYLPIFFSLSSDASHFIFYYELTIHLGEASDKVINRFSQYKEYDETKKTLTFNDYYIFHIFLYPKYCEIADGIAQCSKCRDNFKIQGEYENNYREYCSPGLTCSDGYLEHFDGTKRFCFRTPNFECREGYSNIDPYTCVKCDSKFGECAKCTETECLECINGGSYGLIAMHEDYNDDGSNRCIRINSSCPTGYKLHDNLHCYKGTECREGFYEKIRNECTSCNEKFGDCKTCDYSTCSECKDGALMHISYNSDGTNRCVFNNGECSSGYYLTEENNCQKCTVANCDKCLNSGSDKCDMCIAGFYLSSETECTNCPDNCDQCEKDGNCIQCKEGYITTKTDQTECIENEDKNCIIARNSICVQCIPGFKVDSSGKCTIPCDCPDCYEDNQCTFCFIDQYLENNECHSCSEKFEYCNSCTASQCTECISGYYIEETGKCTKCNIQSENVKRCVKNQIIECEDNYAIHLNYNDDGSNRCLEPCDAGYYQSGSVCLISDPPPDIDNCAKMNRNGECVECLSGYYVNENKDQCIQCKYSFCNGCNKDGCIDCFDGFFKDDNKCIQCNSEFGFCKQCTKTACQRCYDGYHTDETNPNLCVTCDLFENCKSCDAHQCLECKEGALLHLNYNEEDLTNQCIMSPECAFGYAKTDTNACIKSNIDDCRIYSNDGLCLQCAPGYTNKRTECFNCPYDHCDSCDGDYHCEECSEGYFVNWAGSCTRCTTPHCKICDNDICTSCDTGYTEIDHQCTNCHIEHCDDCDASGQCVACVNGYYLDSENSCLECTKSHCQKCKTDGTCETCENGYDKTSDGNCEEKKDPIEDPKEPGNEDPEEPGNEDPKEPGNEDPEKGGNESSNGNKGLTGGEIAGIVIACIVVVAAVLIVLVYFFVIKKKNAQASVDEQQDVDL